METVEVQAKTSFVNRFTGSLTKKQRTFIPASVANELEQMGLVDILTADGKIAPKKSKASQASAEGGTEKQSASSQAATPSAKIKSTQSKSTKTGA